MTRKMRSMIIATAFLGAATTARAVSFYSNSGLACEQAFGFSEPLFRDYDGTWNDSTTGATILNCPIAFSTNQTETLTVNQASVSLIDNSSNLHFPCTPFQKSTSGSVILGRTKEPCSATGGCSFPSSDLAPTGPRGVSWSSSELSPIGALGATASNGIRCDPPARSVFGRSGVNSILYRTP